MIFSIRNGRVLVYQDGTWPSNVEWLALLEVGFEPTGKDFPIAVGNVQSLYDYPYRTQEQTPPGHCARWEHIEEWN